MFPHPSYAMCPDAGRPDHAPRTHRRPSEASRKPGPESEAEFPGPVAPPAARQPERREQTEIVPIEEPSEQQQQQRQHQHHHHPHQQQHQQQRAPQGPSQRRPRGADRSESQGSQENGGNSQANNFAGPGSGRGKSRKNKDKRPVPQAAS